MSGPRFRFSHRLRVRWSECDPQGIAFNGAFLSWLEMAHAEYFRNIGISLYTLAESNVFDTIMAKVGLEFHAPVRLDDEIDLHMRMVRLGGSSFTMECEIHRAGEPTPLARIEVVYVSYDTSHQRSRPIPDDIRRLVAQFEEMDQTPASDGPPSETEPSDD